MGVSLRDKIYGCIAGTHVGSAMAVPTEGMDWAEIQEKYGTLKEFIAYSTYGNTYLKEPGTTEDGIERQKMMISAIIDKQDRITAEDLKKAWVTYMNPEAPGKIAEPFDGVLLKVAQSDIPAVNIGMYCDYSCLCSLARSSHPIALINAGDIENAVKDIYEVGQIYQVSNSSGIQWAAANAIGLAEATRPDATLDSVIGAILDKSDETVAKEIQRGLDITKNCTDFRQMREAFDPYYSGKGMPYHISFANEVVTKGIAVFKMVKGNVYDAIISSVNMGRDTDCLAAISSGLSGALTGPTLPEELTNQVDYAMSINTYTNSQRTIRENADGIYNAYLNRIAKMEKYLESMKNIL